MLLSVRQVVGRCVWSSLVPTVLILLELMAGVYVVIVVVVVVQQVRAGLVLLPVW